MESEGEYRMNWETEIYTIYTIFEIVWCGIWNKNKSEKQQSRVGRWRGP